MIHFFFVEYWPPILGWRFRTSHFGYLALPWPRLKRHKTFGRFRALVVAVRLPTDKALVP